MRHLVVGRVDERQTNPERVAHWNGAVLDRSARARLAVSLVTITEVRAGFAISDDPEEQIGAAVAEHEATEGTA